MARTREVSVEPIRRSVVVSWNQETAFRRFTEEFGKWWPSYGHSIGGKRVKRIVFEPKVGGLIYEEHKDGTRFMWGRVTALEPPRRVAFTHHASHAEEDAQDVEVTFAPEGTGTRVNLVSSGWEKMRSPNAKRSRGGYVMTWTAILSRFAGRNSRISALFAVMSWAMDLTGGRKKFIANSLGRMPNAPTDGDPQ